MTWIVIWMFFDSFVLQLLVVSMVTEFVFFVLCVSTCGFLFDPLSVFPFVRKLVPSTSLDCVSIGNIVPGDATAC